MTTRWLGRSGASLVLAMILLPLPTSLTAARQDDGLSPSALSCPLEPLTLPLFGGTPAASLSTPVPELALDAGQPVPEAMRDEIEESVEVIIDCANTGEPRYAFAVFTERYLANLFTGEDMAYQPAFERTLTQSAQPPEQPLVPQELGELQLLPDGRVVVELVVESGYQTFSDTLVLAKGGDYWLVDQVVERAPASGTPPRIG